MENTVKKTSFVMEQLLLAWKHFTQIYIYSCNLNSGWKSLKGDLLYALKC